NGLLSIYAPLSAGYEADVNYIPDKEMISSAAAAADTAVFFISRWAGECRDMAPADWDLSATERALLTDVCAAFDRVIFVLNKSGPIDTTWAHGEVEGIDVDALLFVCYGGMVGGYAVSNILTGLANPSGKRSTTFAKNLSDYPSHGNYGEKTVNYAEGIYLGYRHFDTFAPDRVSYGFGYGLSYTDFEMRVTAFSADDETVKLSVEVKNIGELAGKEVVQVYFSSPDKNSGAALDAAAHELATFAKTDMLNPGECVVINLSFPVEQMKRYDEDGATGYTSAYVLEAGEYRICVGNSLADAASRVAGALILENTRLVKQLTRQFVPVDLVKKAEEKSDADDSSVSTEQQYDITVTPDMCTEVGANPDVEPPVLKSFDGYIFDSNTSKWIPYSGSCLCNMGNNGAYAIYRFDAPETASYKMSLRLASHAYDASYKLYYSDDNTNFSPLSTALKITNTFESSDNLSHDFAFMDFSCGKLKLREGANYIKVEQTSSISPNLALIRFAKIEDKNDTNEGGADVIRFDRVLDGSASIADYVGQMTDYELAEFFVAYTGKLSSEAGGSDALCAKYGHRRMNMTDGPAGVRENASSWPAETIVASTWNIDLVHEMGVIIGIETKQN
ncbi:MAG: glycoside hydrolase family 3 C-terminal domain-containing protein, partial [Clostridia bacterium]|nr:glycoside hydrolase family 3 C-terminal domain-containing protein [Clostridia bacterium]